MEIAELLLSVGCRPDVADSNGFIAFDWLAFHLYAFSTYIRDTKVSDLLSKIDHMFLRGGEGNEEEGGGGKGKSKEKQRSRMICKECWMVSGANKAPIKENCCIHGDGLGTI